MDNMFNQSLHCICTLFKVNFSVSLFLFFHCHTLYQVTFDDYDGAIGFVNVGNVHWKFVVSI